MYFLKGKLQFGDIICRIEENGDISGLWFEGQKYFPEIPDTSVWLDEKSKINNKVDLSVKKLIEQLEEYDNGVLKKFELPLYLKGTDFQMMVWKILLEIPYGETRTYKEIGIEVAKLKKKNSMSAQAIGGAVGHNPISVIVPCHRVLGSKGKLTGYAGGIDKKIGLLKHEGVKISLK